MILSGVSPADSAASIASKTLSKIAAAADIGVTPIAQRVAAHIHAAKASLGEGSRELFEAGPVRRHREIVETDLGELPHELDDTFANEWLAARDPRGHDAH